LNLRSKLEKRVHRVKSTKWPLYVPVLRQFWTFYDSEPVFVAVAEELLTRFPQAKMFASALVNGVQKEEMTVADDEAEWAANAYFVLREFAKESDSRNVTKFVPLQTEGEYDAYLKTFGAFFLDPFYDYVEERLDDARFVLGQLLRFKHLCEWFWRSELFAAWNDNTNRGEKILAVRLYEFLYREGIRIHIEPSSASGEADMVGSQEGPDRLVADAKIFNPDKGKGAKYIVQGFRQIAQYAADYNEVLGYLVIFNTSNKQLRFAVESGSQPLPKIELNHKTIFYLVIDLYPHETSASKRPQAEVVEITQDEIAAFPAP
jgi:hypothetical protein